MHIISLCDRTGNIVRPFAEAGFKCLCIDTQHSIRRDRVEGNITYRWGDVMGLSREDLPPALAWFAQPPCTHGAVSGARDHKRKGLRGLILWLEVFERCRELCESDGAPYLIEQPVVDSVIARRWREPDFSFDPCDYGDPWTKRTNIWLGGGFVMPPKTPVAPDLGSMMHTMAPSDDRQDKRAETSQAFARAFFEANVSKLTAESHP